jgi:hypothetical protein
MERVWCDWEETEFDRDKFDLYQGGPLLEHLDVKPRHTNNGIEIGGLGPQPADAAEASSGTEGQPSSVGYGRGPMARPGNE